MPIKTYKGMDKNMRCRGFQYEVGGEYEEDGVDVCSKGFHAYEVPLNVFDYYPPSDSRYFECEQSGDLDRAKDDSKVASSKIKIGAEIGIPGLVKAHIEYIKENLVKGDGESATNTGCRSAATVSGKDSVAIVTGYHSKTKASLGSAIIIAERGEWNGKTYPLIGIRAAIIDGEVLKPDTFYTLKNGEFVEVTDENNL